MNFLGISFTKILVSWGFHENINDIVLLIYIYIYISYIYTHNIYIYISYTYPFMGISWKFHQVSHGSWDHGDWATISRMPGMTGRDLTFGRGVGKYPRCGTYRWGRPSGWKKDKGNSHWAMGLHGIYVEFMCEMPWHIYIYTMIIILPPYSNHKLCFCWPLLTPQQISQSGIL